MALRGKARRSGGDRRRCAVGVAFVLLVAQLATGSQHVSGGAAVSAPSDPVRDGGSRMLQDGSETPAPAEVVSDSPAPVAAPVVEESAPETPAPVDVVEDAAGDTPSPAAQTETSPPVDTPNPTAAQPAAQDTPNPTVVAEADDTPSPAGAQPVSPDTPNPTAATEQPVAPETTNPTAPGEQPAAPETTNPTAPGEQPVAGETSVPTAPVEQPVAGETPSPTPAQPTAVETVNPTTTTTRELESPAPADQPTSTLFPTGGAEPSAGPTPTPVVPEPVGTPAPFAPSTCSNGIPGVSADGVCCKEECGLCGGQGCGAVAGTNGASDCCPDTIIEESGGAFCGVAPCVMEGNTPSPVNPAFVGTAAPVVPSTCSNGIFGYQDGNVCCAESCGTCGGAGCGTIPGTGGSSNCCPSDILAAGTICGEAPCIIEGYTPAPAVVGGGTSAPIGTATCSNGMLGYQDGPVCCAANCGQCGAEGCGAIPGTAGASACCSSTIAAAGTLCSATGSSPCVIDDYTPAPAVPDYGTAAPVFPSTCSNGLAGYQNNDICCLEACGRCGGTGCGTIPGTGGSSNCCPGTIRTAGQYCGVNGREAPCIIGDYTPAPANPALFGTAAPVVATTCSNGLPGFQNGAACCKESCGQCGGVGCGTIPGTGGSANCCASEVLMTGLVCGNGVEAPCVIENYTPAPMGVPGDLQPFAPSTCTNGMQGVQDENICCAENCGQCGGVGCGTVPGTGGSEACCSGTIAVNGTDCNMTGSAPCIIGDWAATPSPTVFVAMAPVAPSTCSNGLPGYQDGNVCCLMACGQCGGVGCGSIPGTAGASDCCPSTILNATGMGYGYECGGTVMAPCVIAATPAPTPAPAVTKFPTPVPFVAGNANDFLNTTTTAAAPALLWQPAGLFLPVLTATAAVLGGMVFLGGGRDAAGF